MLHIFDHAALLCWLVGLTWGLGLVCRWMLQISTPGMEANLGINFADEYRKSSLYRCALPPSLHSSLPY